MDAAQEDVLGKIIFELYSQPGVSGSCVQAGREVVRHDLPFSDDRIANFAAKLDHFIGSYESVDRTVWQLCAVFEKYWLLVLCRGEIRLSLLLNPDADTSTIGGRGAHLLMQLEPVPPPAPPVIPAAVPAATNGTNGAAVASANGHGVRPAKEIDGLLGNLLGRVMGSAQASKLIAREAKNRPPGDALSRDDAKAFGFAVLDYIPNRGKRQALVSEFLNAIEK